MTTDELVIVPALVRLFAKTINPPTSSVAAAAIVKLVALTARSPKIVFPALSVPALTLMAKGPGSIPPSILKITVPSSPPSPKFSVLALT